MTAVGDARKRHTESHHDPAVARLIDEVRAEAWDEGHAAGVENKRSESQFIRFVATNPYRDGGA